MILRKTLLALPTSQKVPKRKYRKSIGFRSHIVPARDPVALADILNAGWKAFHDPKLWEEQVEEKDRDRTLKELLLKSIEVLEFRTRTKASP